MLNWSFEKTVWGYSMTPKCALTLAKNTMPHERTKHVAIKYHFVKDTVADGVVTLFKIHTRHCCRSPSPAELWGVSQPPCLEPLW